MSALRVRQRDKSLAPFDPARVRAAVLAAQDETGLRDARAASDVAELVARALERRAAARDEGGVFELDEVGDLVEEALIELGHASVAKVAILARARAGRAREAAAGAPEGGPGGGAGGADLRRAPLVRVDSGVEPWSRARISAALVEEADLPRALAEEVALRVEERVLESGLRRVTPSLVRELVDNELVERGLTQALRRARPIGLPRHDLARWVRGAPEPDGGAGVLSPRSLERRVAGGILRRFALEDVLSEPLSEALASGEFGLCDLERPHLDLALALPSELVPSRTGGAGAWELVDACAQAAAAVARGVVLEDAGTALAALARKAGAEERIESWLCALAAVARCSGVAIDLAFAPSERSDAPAWLERALTALAALDAAGHGPHLPRAVLDANRIVALAEHDPALARTLETLLAHGRIVPTFDGRARALPHGLVRGPRERGAVCVRAAAVLNLPRAARRAGPWREDAMFAELSAMLARALDALAQLDELTRAPAAVPWRAAKRCALFPAGLRAALLWMGDGEAQPESAARLLAFLSEAAARLGRERGLAVQLASGAEWGEAARFATLDARRFRERQPLFFGLAEAAPAAYGIGFDLPLAPGSPQARAEHAAEALAALPCWALEGGALLEALSVGLEARTPRVEALALVARARTRLRSRTGALFALPGGAEPALWPDAFPAVSALPDSH